MIYILILNIVLSVAVPVIIIKSGFGKSDATPVVIALFSILLLYSLLIIFFSSRIKSKIRWSVLSIIIAVCAVAVSYFHFKNNLFATDTNKHNYPAVITESKSMWPKMLRHFPDKPPTQGCFYLLKSTLDISKIQLTVPMTKEEIVEIYGKAKLSAVYSQKGFEPSKSNKIWSTQFWSLDGSEYANLSDDYEVFVLYLPEDSNEPMENWQNIYCNSGIVVNTVRNVVIYWAVFPY